MRVLAAHKLPHPLFPPLAFSSSGSAAVSVGVILDATIAHPQGGGQPGDQGYIVWRRRAEGGSDTAGRMAADEYSSCCVFRFVTTRWCGDAIAHFGSFVDVSGVKPSSDLLPQARAWADALGCAEKSSGETPPHTPPPPPPLLHQTTDVDDTIERLVLGAKGREEEGEVEVSVFISRPFRSTCAALHSAGHLLDAAVKNALLNLGQRGFWGTRGAPLLSGGKGNHFPEGPPSVEYSGSVPAELLGEFAGEVQTQVGLLVDGGQATRTLKLPGGKGTLNSAIEAGETGGLEVGALKQMDLSGFPAGKLLRVVAVGSHDNVCPCGGTHVKRVESLKTLKVLKVASKKGVTKISYGL